MNHLKITDVKIYENFVLDVYKEPKRYSCHERPTRGQ